MRIVWNSVAPWIPTGYAQQTAMFTPRIRDLGNEVILSSFVGIEGCITSWNGMRVYPGDVSKLQKWSLKRIVAREAGGEDHLREIQVITLQDCWTWLEAAYGGIADWHGLKIASWCPVDHDPCPPGVVRALKEYDARPIAMSRFGQGQLQKFDFDPLYVPHGVETSILKPLPGAREAVREVMKVPNGAVLFGMVSNNNGIAPPRKAFPQVFEAFALLAEKHDDVFLYMHTDEYGINQGLNLQAMAKLYNIHERTFFVENDPYWWGEIMPEHMSAIYNSLDCLLCPSYGEGFGIPIIEAQACGTPVIVNNWTSMPELVGAGWICEGERWYNPGAGTCWKIPSIHHLVELMEEAYKSAGDEKLRHRARVFAEQYDADLILEKYWKPVLAALEAPREVGPLPNRAARRHRNKRQKQAA